MPDSFKLKLECLSDQKSPQIFLLFNYFSSLVTKAEAWYYKNLKFVSRRFLDR